MVFASHAANVCYGGAYLGNGGGQLGVMLFFLLSGYLMSMLYMELPSTIATQWRFVVSRGARIYPMFFVVVVVSFGVSLTGAHVATYGIRTVSDLVQHLFLMKGYSVFWTIGPEVVFYGLFLVLWAAKWRGTAVFLVLLIAALLVSTVPGDPTRSNSVASLHQRLPYFLAGMVMGFRHDILMGGAGSKRSAWKNSVFGLCLLAFVFCCPQLTRMAIGLPKSMLADPSSSMWSYPFYLAVSSALLMSAVVAKPWLLTNPVAVFMGRISFSFYLLHVAVLINLHLLLPIHPVRVIAGSLAVTVALSFACYTLIEVPSRNAIRKLRQPRCCRRFGREIRRSRAE